MVRRDPHHHQPVPWRDPHHCRLTLQTVRARSDVGVGGRMVFIDSSSSRSSPPRAPCEPIPRTTS
jgi:hypothetical protein